MELTENQKKFCEAYVRTGSPSNAYREAYPAKCRTYRAKTVHAHAVKMLKMEKIKEYIAELGDAPKLVEEQPAPDFVAERCHCRAEDFEHFKDNAEKIMIDALAAGDLHTALDANRFLCDLAMAHHLISED